MNSLEKHSRLLITLLFLLASLALENDTSEKKNHTVVKLVLLAIDANNSHHQVGGEAKGKGLHRLRNILAVFVDPCKRYAAWFPYPHKTPKGHSQYGC